LLAMRVWVPVYFGQIDQYAVAQLADQLVAQL
jgi:hypothetical protein